MTVKFTKTNIKTELQRRIDRIGNAYGFSDNTTVKFASECGPHVSHAFGIYSAYKQMIMQIDYGIFIDGAVK